MIEKLLEFLKEMGSLMSPLVIVHPWEGAGILRFGKYHRTVGPGFYFKRPLIEDVVHAETCQTTMRLPPQSLTTKDKIEVAISCIVRYQIVDLQRYICDIWDQKDVLGDVTMGAVGRTVREKTYQELMEAIPEDDITEKVRKEVNRFGFQIKKVTVIDLCRAKSLRLIQAQTGKDLDN